MAEDSPLRTVRIGKVARDLGVSPTYIRKLADAGVIPYTVTQGGHRLFDLAEAQAAFRRRRDLRVELEFPLAGLEEDKVWDSLQAQAPPRHATKQAIGIARYAFTELV